MTRLARTLLPGTVSPERFRALSLLTLIGLFAVVVTGATVRLTASGLGCENWPRCGNTPVPTDAQGGHSVIEFSNRLVAAAVVALTLLLWLNARRLSNLSAADAATGVRPPALATRDASTLEEARPATAGGLTPAWVRPLTLALFLGTFAQIPLGGILTLANLNPYLVMWHFLLALAALGAGIVLTLAVWLPRSAPGSAVPWPLPGLGLVLMVAAAALVVTGAFATASGPHPGSLSEIRRIYTVEGTVWVHVRATAVFGITFGIVLLTLLARARRLALAAIPLLVLLGAQMIVGEVQYRTGLPWWLVLIHVGLAASVWAATVLLVTILWLPTGSPGGARRLAGWRANFASLAGRSSSGRF